MKRICVHVTFITHNAIILACCVFCTRFNQLTRNHRFTNQRRYLNSISITVTIIVGGPFVIVVVVVIVIGFIEYQSLVNPDSYIVTKSNKVTIHSVVRFEHVPSATHAELLHLVFDVFQRA